MNGIYLTQDLLTQAFLIWNKKVNENHGNFDFNAIHTDPEDCAKGCAEYLLHILRYEMRMDYISEKGGC
jgi:hypothetical protein